MSESNNTDSSRNVQGMPHNFTLISIFGQVSGLLKASEALTGYSGGRMRRRYLSPSDQTGSVVHRLHHLRPIEHKGGTINSRVGLGRGWEKFGQGVTVDSPRRKFKV